MHGEFHTGIEPAPEPPPRRNPAVRWLRWIIARNPLYPISAALLLYGINRLSTDPGFLPVEEANLLFNFSALQVYEIMLVGVALLLAVRRIHYDATLLAVIENGLVFVPFILVTQAVLIGRSMAGVLCGAAAALALVRFNFVRRTRVLLPPRLLTLGTVVLLFNLVLPFVYRSRMELDATDWMLPGRFCWLVLLPLFVLLANAMEQPRIWSGEPHRQSWLPLLMVGLWISATAIHLRCIDYISGLAFEAELLAPLLWASAWTACFRAADFSPDPLPRARRALLIISAVAPFLDTRLGYTYLALACLNVVFSALVFARTQERAAFQVLLCSLAVAVVGMIKNVVLLRIDVLNRFEWLLVAAGAALAIHALMSRKPVLGLTAALAIGALSGFFLQQPFIHLSIQYAAAFLLIHSLWWERPEEPGAVQLRAIAAMIWVCDSMLWTWSDSGAFRIVGAVSMMVLAACILSRWLRGYWEPRIVVIAACICLFAAPAHYLFGKVKTSPAGLVALIGSFLLFGLGTIAALTRSAWNPSVSRNNE
jgi:hypothetical protein